MRKIFLAPTALTVFGVAPVLAQTSALTDSTGASWAVTKTGTVTRNGQSAAFTAQVVNVANVGGTIYQQTAFGGWWAWDGSGWVGVSGDPTQGAPVTVTTVADGQGQNYALSPSGAVLINGTPAANATTAVEVLDVGGVAYTEDANGNWLAWLGQTPQSVVAPSNLPATCIGLSGCLTLSSAAATALSATASPAVPNGTVLAPPPPATTAPVIPAVCGTGTTSIANQPDAAALAGYNTLTFGPDIRAGGNWFPDTQHGGSPNITENADGSLTVAGGGDTWNGQMQTATPTWPGMKGMSFGGGFYAQATMAVPGPTAGLSSWTGSTYPGNQWPSFWANAVDPATGAIGVETDIVEQMAGTEGHYGSTVINWTQPSGGQPNTGWSQDITAPGGNTLHGANTYGMLWIPATASTGGSLTFFLNGNPVGQPVTWTQANPGSWGLIDQEKMTLYFGAGGNSPATFSNIQVWQASTAANSMNGGPAPAMTPATSTTTKTPALVSVCNTVATAPAAAQAQVAADIRTQTAAAQAQVLALNRTPAATDTTPAAPSVPETQAQADIQAQSAAVQAQVQAMTAATAPQSAEADTTLTQASALLQQVLTTLATPPSQ